MRIVHWVRGISAVAFALGVGSPVAAQKASPASDFTIELDPRAAAGKPGPDVMSAPAPTVFAQLPARVHLSTTMGTLSLTESSPGAGRLVVPTGGASKCVRVFAHSPGEDPSPLQFAIVKQGDRDPCTNQPLTGPVVDFTTPAPQPQAYKLWLLKCKVGKGCHWLIVNVHKAPGVPYPYP